MLLDDQLDFLLPITSYITKIKGYKKYKQVIRDCCLFVSYNDTASLVRSLDFNDRSHNNSDILYELIELSNS